MKKRVTHLVLSIALISPCLSSYADTYVILQGRANSTQCKSLGLEGMRFSVNLTMPSNRLDYPVINETNGFKLLNRTVQFNNMGIEQSCDYYAYGNRVKINGQDFFLQRLTIDSEEKPIAGACVNVYGELNLTVDPDASSAEACSIVIK